LISFARHVYRSKHASSCIQRIAELLERIVELNPEGPPADLSFLVEYQLEEIPDTFAEQPIIERVRNYPDLSLQLENQVFHGTDTATPLGLTQESYCTIRESTSLQ
jgi:hypothetical protein